jgi:hypothetical protein
MGFPHTLAVRGYGTAFPKLHKTRQSLGDTSEAGPSMLPYYIQTAALASGKYGKLRQGTKREETTATFTLLLNAIKNILR